MMSVGILCDKEMQAEGGAQVMPWLELAPVHA